MSTKLDALRKEIRTAQHHRELARYYDLNSILGNTWAMFYCIIGARKTGKSYAVADFCCNQKEKFPDTKIYWMRISDTSVKAMLADNCKGLIDPDLQRKYDLELKTKGMYVKNHGKDFMTVCPLSSFGKLKGVGFYDKDFKGKYIIILDEFQLEINEKRTSFDILYNFIGMCENLVRTTKSNIRIFLLGNTLQEASTILKAFNFVPEIFGRFYLKSKRCVIDNLEPTEEYFQDRKGSISDILGGGDMSNFNNKMKKDVELISKDRLIRPTAIIKFSKDSGDWYTLWDGKVVKKYKGELLPDGSIFNMRPYLSGLYSKERVKAVIDLYDNRQLYYKNLIDQAYFEGELQKIRKM